MIESPDPSLPRPQCGSPTPQESAPNGQAPDPTGELLALAKGGDGNGASNPEGMGSNGESSEFKHIRDGITALHEELGAMRAELGRVRTADRVLHEMHTRCQELSEQFHEREVLNPIFLGLIGVADRCWQQVQRIQQTLKGTSRAKEHPALEALRYLAEARTADRIEVDGLLAHFAVEPYEHPGSMFDPGRQKCVGRVESLNSEPPGRVAARMLPGYQRNGKCIRPEYVKVYVQTKMRINRNGERQ